MATILGGVFSSHVPAIGAAIARGQQREPYRAPVFDGFVPIRRWLATARPDTVVVFYNDHGLNIFLDRMPTFAVGAAPRYDNADEGWGLPLIKGFAGAPKLSWHIVETLVDSKFHVTTCQAMQIDHGGALPFELCSPDADAWPVRIVPIAINTVQHPLPSPRRCLAFGRAVGQALRTGTGPERILVMGTGRLSHQLDGQRAGFINPDYARFCLDHLGSDPDRLTGHSSLDIVELAGSQGVEMLNGIAARGALGAVEERARNYEIPISNTASASLLLACRAATA